ncbi:proteinase-activated receptor 3-like [Huso huso]|uniref:Proteinase-activated receptor 3-like n=1 Tax=Huso huso TaxID=61971 RepID=A0ABR1ACS6_HUSHU
MKRLLLLSAAVFLYLDPVLCENGSNSHMSDITNVLKTFNASPVGEEPWLYIDNPSTIEYLSGDISTLVIPAVYILVVITGLPANAVVLWMLLSKTKTFSTAVLYFSLALSDLLFLVTLTFKIHYHLNGNNWTLGETMCQVVTASFYGNMYCTILNHMCLSINRYLAIVHPFTYRSLPKRKCAIGSCILVWACFFAAMAPVFFITQSYTIPQIGNSFSTCHDVLPHSEKRFLLKFYSVLLPVWGFFIPLIVASFCYISILRNLDKSEQIWYWYMKMTGLFFLIFIICFTPSNIINVVHYIRLYSIGKDDFYIYYNIAMCFNSLHSSLDPFLFFLRTKSSGLHFHASSNRKILSTS